MQVTSTKKYRIEHDEIKKALVMYFNTQLGQLPGIEESSIQIDGWTDEDGHISEISAELTITHDTTI
jgi:hypothetical protein